MPPHARRRLPFAVPAVESGGLFLTKQQLDDDPALAPPANGTDRSIGPIPVPDDY